MNDLSSGLDYAVSPCARPGSRARNNGLHIRQLAAVPRAVLTILLVSFIGTPAAVLAADIKNYTRSELDGWLAKYSDAKPERQSRRGTRPQGFGANPALGTAGVD